MWNSTKPNRNETGPVIFFFIINLAPLANPSRWQKHALTKIDAKISTGIPVMDILTIRQGAVARGSLPLRAEPGQPIRRVLAPVSQELRLQGLLLAQSLKLT
jgi:hypothetical protein